MIYMRWFYVGWLGLTSAAILLQLYLAGYGVFGFSGVGAFGAHLFLGFLIGVAVLVGIVLAFAARVPWRITLINGVLSVLMVIQFVLAHRVQAIAALHVVNGVLIFALMLFLTREAWRLAKLQRAPARRLKPVPTAEALPT